MDQFGGYLAVNTGKEGTRITAWLPRSVFVAQSEQEAA
jgi:signal transduction histidine kinase